ncbi:winged helix-turn-helix domain-containing protein [Brevibacterium casei]|uniref:Helix-turn-helix transcriptional regulator n=1 Tax=Brevibacterium casei TaxID=33889 RepID=A0A7T2TIE3_9MICO|nr:winged helix-turn-helix domain-containing protein [Brevibacterium casei]QPS34343.1 helix-turn-helix transcriptional regulator [Brevibacterium casei]
MSEGSDRTGDAAASGSAAAGVSLEDRLARLEHRVAELESSAGSIPAGNSAEAGVPAPARFPADDGTFWALDGLVERLGPTGGIVYTGHVTPPGTESPVSWQMGLTAEAFTDIDFAEAAPALTAFSHPVRLALLQAVYEGTTTVAELSADDRFGTTGQIYHHLKALASAGWLENIPRGHWRVPAQKVVPLLTLILIGTH